MLHTVVLVPKILWLPHFLGGNINPMLPEKKSQLDTHTDYLCNHPHDFEAGGNQVNLPFGKNIEHNKRKDIPNDLHCRCDTNHITCD